MSEDAVSAKQLLTGYKSFPLPNLSTVRRPPAGSVRTNVPVPQPCTELAVLIALARLLGAHASTNDIVLRWDTQAHQSIVRIHWQPGYSWEDVQNNIALASYDATDILKDSDDQPFTVPAALSDDLESGHSLTLKICNTVLHLRADALLFHQSTLQVLAEQLYAILNKISLQPTSLVGDLSFLPPVVLSRYDHEDEQHTYTHVEPFHFVAEVIIRQACQRPDEIALEYHPSLASESSTSVRLTYGSLNALSNQCARHFLAMGLRREDRVALCMARGLMFHVCMLGILKAGGCYVPIDPELPPERKNFISRDSGAKFTLYDSSVQALPDTLAGYSSDDICLAQSEDLAYLLYTSGTTGTPKGCLLTQRGLSEAIIALSWFSFVSGADDARYLAVASIAFDVHLAETFVSWVLGMTLITASRSELFEDLPGRIRSLEITHVGIVPSLIEATMCSYEESEKDNAEAPRMRLRFIASGGEKISDTILDRWADHPDVKLVNFYGPSEVTIGCAGHIMQSDTKKENIGKTFLNCSSYVVDENMQLVPRGVPGELIVSGPLVGRGYHGRPDLTQKSFLHWEGKWAYRTGDLVRMMPDSTLEIMGRIDTQIKLRGVRIEAEGISSIIRSAASSCHEVTRGADAYTILTRHPALNTDQIISFAVWNSTATVAERKSSRPQIITDPPPHLMRTLKAACVKELASYMRPAYIIPLSFIPLNPNGKADGKMLASIFCNADLGYLMNDDVPTPSVDSSSLQTNSLTETESTIVGLIKEQISDGVGKLGPETNLFKIGFDSMKLIQLCSSLRRTFPSCQPSTSTSELMSSPIVRTIAEIIDDRCSFSHSQIPLRHPSIVQDFAKESQKDVFSSFDEGNIKAILPTFPIQDGVLYRSAEVSTLYVQHVILRLDAGVSLDDFKNAWSTVIKRHDILRAVFLFSTSIIQVITDPSYSSLRWVDKDAPVQNEDEFVSYFLSEEAPKISKEINEKVSLQTPLKLCLFRFGETNICTLSIHHALYDAVSLPLLLKDADLAYHGKSLGPSSPLDQILEEICSVDSEKAHKFWSGHFEGFDWSKCGSRLSTESSFQELRLPFTLKLSELEKMAADCQVSLQALLASAYALCLGRFYYAWDDLTIGLIRAGRSLNIDGIETAQCPVLTVQPLRVRLRKDGSLCSQVQSDLARMTAFEHIPLSKVQQWIRPGETLFETLFSISIQEDFESNIWKVLDSTQPQPDYYLAVEVVLNRLQDSATINVAFTPSDIPPAAVTLITQNLECMIIEVGHGLQSTFEAYGTYMQPASAADKVSDDEDEESEPDTQMMTSIRDHVSDFLSVDANIVPFTASLFSFGLDSIKSLGLSRKLRTSGYTISAAELMRRQNLKRIAAYFRPHSTDSANESDATSTLLKSAIDGLTREVDVSALKLSEHDAISIFPATALQSGMLSQTISSTGKLYVHPFLMRLADDVDISLLKTSWKRAAQMCTILRTSFYFTPNLGSWVQVVHSADDLKWDEIVSPSSPDLLDSLSSFVTAVAPKIEDDFARSPLHLRLLISEDGHLRHLLVVMHHALYDGASVPKIFNLVESLYRGAKPSDGEQFHELLGYFLYQERHGSEYWLQKLHAFHPTPIPRATGSVDQSAHAATLDIDLTPERFSLACRSLNVNPQCFGMATWAKVLMNLTNQRDVVFGHIISGRNAPNAEDVIGPVLNTIPCRVQITSGMRNVEILESIHLSALESLEWQHASLRSIQRGLGLSSLWDSTFLFQPLQDEGSSSLWQPEQLSQEEVEIQYGISIELHQKSDRIAIVAACRSDVMAQEDFTNLLAIYRRIFLHLVEHPGDTSDFDVTASSESDLAQQVSLGQEVPTLSVWPTAGLAIRDSLANVTGIQVEAIHPYNSLISLGVDSITAMQLASNLRSSGLKVTAANILQCEHAADLLAFMENNTNSVGISSETQFHVSSADRSAVADRLGASLEDIQTVCLPSPGMKWLVGIWQRSDRSRFQHAFAFRLHHTISKERLYTAWSALVNSNAILRSTFASPSSSRNFLLVTFKALSPDSLWSEDPISEEEFGDDVVTKYLHNLVSTPLSTQRPPLRAIYLTGGENRYLVLHLHHVHYDAWSLHLLLDELRSIYEGGQPKQDRFNELIQGLSFNDKIIEEQRKYWRAHFPPSFERTLFPKLNISGNGAERMVTIRSVTFTELHSLKQASQKNGVSMNSIFLAAWARIQSLYTNSNAITFGLWHLGRSGVIDEMEDLAVPCINTLPVHIPQVCDNIQELASNIQALIRGRSPIVEHSDLEAIDQWVDGCGRSLCNVYINVILAPSTSVGAGSFFEPVGVPYSIPPKPATESCPTVNRLAITDLIQDDLLIDIAISEEEQTITFAIECNEDIMSKSQALEVMDEWMISVRSFL